MMADQAAEKPRGVGLGADDRTSLPPLGPRASLLYWATYLHYGFVAFLPLWLSNRGASPAQIGTIMAIPLVLRLLTVAPFAAWVGKLGRVRDAIAWTALGAAALILLLLPGDAFLWRVAVVLVFSITWDQLPVLVDAYAVMAVRRQGLDFGRLRVWGSIAVVVSNLAAGWLIGKAGIFLLPAWIAALLLLPAAATLALPRDALLGAGEDSAARHHWREVLADRGLLGAMLAASLIMGSHGVVMNFGAIQWAAAHIAPGYIGVLTSVAVAAEIGFYWFGRALLGKRDPRLLLVAAALASVLRWGLMALNPGFAVLVAAQLLHGVTSTGAILSVMLLIGDRVPAPLVASAQGINAVLVGVVLAAVFVFSGFIWNLGVAPAYAMMSLIALAALLPLALMRGGRVAA